MSDLSGTVRVVPSTLNSLADSIESRAMRIEQRVQQTITTLENLIQGGGFEGARAQIALWQYEQQKPTLLMWSKRLQTYSTRLYAASEAIKIADETKQVSSHTYSNTFQKLFGISRDHGYQQLLEAEAKLRNTRGNRDSIAIALMLQRIRMADLEAQLADYDEVSGDNLNAYVEDAYEYFHVRQNGRRNEIETEIAAVRESIKSYENDLAQAEADIHQLTAEAETAAYNIQKRVQDVGGHEILFHQQMSPKPPAEPGWCLKFVVNWRPDINAGFGSAANLLTTNDNTVAPYRYNIDATTVLPDRMVPGDLVVWNRGQQGVNSEHGHVAIIMEVHDNSVIVKETDWGNVVDTWREIPRSKLQELAFVGQP